MFKNFSDYWQHCYLWYYFYPELLFTRFLESHNTAILDGNKCLSFQSRCIETTQVLRANSDQCDFWSSEYTVWISQETRLLGNAWLKLCRRCNQKRFLPGFMNLQSKACEKDGFFITSTTWEALNAYIHIYILRDSIYTMFKTG